MTYFFFLTEAIGAPSKKELKNRMGALETIIQKNSACTMPLLDTHSIVIQMVFLYLYHRSNGPEDIKVLGKYMIDTVINLIKRYEKQGMWPEMTGNRLALARSLYKKDDDYCCESSLLLTLVFELLAYLNLSETYERFRKVVTESGVNLQIAFPITDEYDIEQLLFEHRLYEEMAVQTDIKIPETIDDYQENFMKKYSSMTYRTDAAGYGFLRILAHKYYETDLFPDFLGRAYCKD